MHHTQAKLAQSVLALEYKYLNIVEALKYIAPGLLYGSDSDPRLLELAKTYQESIEKIGKVLVELAAREAAAD